MESEKLEMQLFEDETFDTSTMRILERRLEYLKKVEWDNSQEIRRNERRLKVLKRRAKKRNISIMMTFHSFARGKKPKLLLKIKKWRLKNENAKGN